MAHGLQAICRKSLCDRLGTRIRFYIESLGMRATYRNDEIGWAQLATGEGQLALERVDPSDKEGKALVARFVGVSWRVSDIWSTHEILAERGVDFVGRPRNNPGVESWPICGIPMGTY